MQTTRPSRHRPSSVTEEGRRTWIPGAVLVVQLGCLPLGATPTEVANGLCVVTALWLAVTRRPDFGPLAGPALALAVGWLALAAAPGGAWGESLGRVWALSAVWAVPVVAACAGRAPWLAVGLGAAALVAVVGVAQGGLGLLGVAAWPPTSAFSHHLTLAYALVPPLFAAIGARRPVVAVAIGAGIASTASLGAGAAVAVGGMVWLGARWGRGGQVAAAAAGMAGSIAAILAVPTTALTQRAVLWTGGARVAIDGGTPPGTWREVIGAHHRALDPGFDFPHHAHDSYLQVAAEAGFAAWIGLAWAAIALLRNGAPWLVAMAAALAVGALTQDVLGDLEVLRAACVWAALGLAIPGAWNRERQTASANSGDR